ncbi:DUF1801 domain-containing protein [Spirosoma soli]|uniref:DUF1801 domain-containing protein n=1 Tax=Spirosoma soli TaxID=1770529 RepID=A0ABW5LYV3_9BACT
MTVDDYINQQTSDHQRILRWLRQLILTTDPAVREKIGWQVPVYTCRTQLLCYLNIVRAEAVAVDLAFMRGADLPDEAGLLESRGRKQIKSLVIRNVTDWNNDLIRTYIQEALLLSEGRGV